MKSGYRQMRCGLLGEHLGHSFSPQIHSLLADYSYDLVEKAPDEVADFVRNNQLDAYNVTVPYKKTVMPYLDEISPEALSIGAVNTVVRGKDGKLRGYNTDYFGFSYMLDISGIKVKKKKVVVFGNGGAAATVFAVLRDRGVGELVVISSKDNTPENVNKHSDANVIINTTPVGMYPNNGSSPTDLSVFSACEGVLDVIYNPARTKLLLDAEERGIPNINGLSMLVAQAVKAFEYFTGDAAEENICEKITSIIEQQTKNIILIGMPGCGKSTVGKKLADLLHRPFYDADAEFAATFDRSPSDIIKESGEECFRQMEHRIAEKLGKLSGAVIACGGGVVTRDYNYPSLHQNGTIIFLERALDKLATEGRPLSQAGPLEQLYNARIDAYRRFADVCVESTEYPMATARLMIEKLGEIK